MEYQTIGLSHLKASAAGGLSVGPDLVVVDFPSCTVQDLGETLHSESHSLVQVTLDDLDVVVEVRSEQLDLRDCVQLHFRCA